MASEVGIISIDFGTSRTKMAYYDRENKRMELFRIGEDDKPFIPSIFYLSNDGKRVFGDEALLLGLDDPLGLLDEPLKRCLRERTIHTSNGQRTTPKELLGRLLSELKTKITQNPAFMKSMPKIVNFTIPVQYGPVDEELLKRAAVDAGFLEDQLHFVYEPVAAAQAWFAETKHSEEYVVVIDCGGGTLDWACLHQKVPGVFEIVPELAPGGDNRIGGYDIDEELFKYVLCNADDNEIVYCRENRPRILQQLRSIKEKYNKTQTTGDIRLQKQRIQINSSVIDKTIEERYIRQLVSTIKPYICKVQTVLKIQKPKVLLVGGSARLLSLSDTLSCDLLCEPIIWERSEYATVLGASINTIANSEKRSNNQYYSENVVELLHKADSAYSIGQMLASYFYYVVVTCFNPSNLKAQQRVTHIEKEIITSKVELENQNKKADKTRYKEIIFACANAVLLSTVELPYHDLDKAELILRKVVELEPNLGLPLLSLGMVSYLKDDIENAVQLLEKALENDPHLVIAQFILSRVMLDVDYEVGFELLDKALQTDPQFVDAVLLLAKATAMIKSDYSAALDLFNKVKDMKAEALETDEELYVQGVCYRELDKNAMYRKLTFKCFDKSAKLGFVDSTRELATCYANGFGIEEDSTKAICLYRLAAEKNDAYSMKVIGDCYKNGYGLDINQKRAFNWFMKAALLDDSEAMMLVSECYKDGIGVSKNLTEARNWELKANEQ